MQNNVIFMLSLTMLPINAVGQAPSDIDPKSICLSTCQLIENINPAQFSAQVFRPVISQIANAMKMTDEQLLQIAPKAVSPRTWSLDGIKKDAGVNWISQLKFLSHYRSIIEQDKDKPTLHRVKIIENKEDIDEYLKLIRESSKNSVEYMKNRHANRFTSSYLVGTALITAFQVWNHTTGPASGPEPYFTAMNVLLGSIGAAAFIDPNWISEKAKIDSSKLKIARFLSPENTKTSHLSLSFEVPSKAAEDTSDVHSSGFLQSLGKSVLNQKSFASRALKGFICWFSRIKSGDAYDPQSFDKSPETEFLFVDLIKLSAGDDEAVKDKLIISTMTSKTPPKKGTRVRLPSQSLEGVRSFSPIPVFNHTGS